MVNNINTPGSAPKKSTPWKVIIPVIVLILVCCLILMILAILGYFGTQGQGPAKFLATDTPTRTPTRTYTPTPEFIPVAIFNSEEESSVSYWSGIWGNNVDTWSSILYSDPENRFSVWSVFDLNSTTLAGYSRLILPDNAIPDYYLADVAAWLSEGNTIIAVDSAITYIAYSGFMWEDSKFFNGQDIYWDYNSLSDDLSLVFGPLTEDVYTTTILSSQSNDARMYSYMLPVDAVILAESYSDPSAVYAACRNVPGGGSIFILGPFDSPEDDVYSFVRNVVFASRCE